MRAQASRYRRVLHGRKPRWLLSGALASLAGYVALAVLAAHQQFFAIDYGTRTWIRIVREETPYLPMALLTELGGPFGILLLIALGSAVLLWRRQRRWALALPALMAGPGALQAIAKGGTRGGRLGVGAWCGLRAGAPPGRRAGASRRERGMGLLGRRVAVGAGAGSGSGGAVALGLGGEGAAVVGGDYGVSVDGRDPSS